MKSHPDGARGGSFFLKEYNHSMAKQSQNKRLVLLDVHAIIHRAYHALPDFVSGKGEPTGALYGLSTMLIKIIEDLKPDYIVACYDLPQPTHRHEVYKEYKAGRKKTDDALVSQLKRSRDIFEAWCIPMYDKPGFEADDMLGTIVTLEKSVDIIIASGDMDTLQLVEDKRVQVYTLKKGINDTILYDEKAVIDRFGFEPKYLPDYKGLRGDPSDNIIGIKGIGEKTAGLLINKFHTLENMYKVLKKTPEKLELTERLLGLIKDGEEEALFSKTLATIRRDAPIDFVLPPEWRECIDIEKLEKLFADLDFRTMGVRLRKLLGVEKEEVKEVIDEAELRETALALWVVDSNKTKPELEDIYNFSKVHNFEQSKKIIFDELEKRNATFIYDKIEKPLIPVVDQMQEVGAKIDVTYLKDLSRTYHKELEKISKKITEYAGEEFNIASPKQLGEILFVKMGLKAKNQKKTGTGAFSTKESELEKMTDLHPIIEEVLKYREYAKLLSTYIDVIPTLVDSEDRVHPKMIQAGAVTGRMASENPSIQNIPNKTDLGRAIRRAFIAEKGYKLVAIDYSQIELRIAAYLSQDEKLLAIFKNKEDVHTAVAAQVFGIDLKDVTKDMRRQAKVINFGVMYGMGVTALQKNLGTDRASAQKFYNEYFEKFSGLATYLEKTKYETAQKGYTETLFGRRRYFEGIRSKLPFIRAAAERMAINAPIQGTEADVIKMAMIKIHEELDVRMLFQVHDELVFEVKEDELAVIPKIQEIMEGIVDFDLTTEARVGDNWEEMK
jgi:DNA polymerase-1